MLAVYFLKGASHAFRVLGRSIPAVALDEALAYRVAGTSSRSRSSQPAKLTSIACRQPKETIKAYWGLDTVGDRNPAWFSIPKLQEVWYYRIVSMG